MPRNCERLLRLCTPTGPHRGAPEAIEGTRAQGTGHRPALPSYLAGQGEGGSAKQQDAHQLSPRCIHRPFRVSLKFWKKKGKKRHRVIERSRSTAKVKNLRLDRGQSLQHQLPQQEMSQMSGRYF